MKCTKCGENRFYFKDWQDERDNINHTCVNCDQRYTPEKETKVNHGMTDDEFWEYVAIEGLEYFINYKSKEWEQLQNPELLQLCLKYRELHYQMMAMQPEKYKYN
jgi:hypothetical protein